MYCSDKQFIDIALATGVKAPDLHALLDVILGLYTRRGSLIKSQKFQDTLSKEFPETIKMIDLLGSVDKLDGNKLRSLLTHIGTSGTQTFEITGSVDEAITKKLEAQFGAAEVAHTSSDELSLQVAGSGRWYKRSLAKDLDKILK